MSPANEKCKYLIFFLSGIILGGRRWKCCLLNDWCNFLHFLHFLSVALEKLTFESAKGIAVHCGFTVCLSGWNNHGQRCDMCQWRNLSYTVCDSSQQVKPREVLNCVELDWDNSKSCMHELHEHDYPLVTKFSIIILHSYNACKCCPAIATWLIYSFKDISITSRGSFLEIWSFSLSQLTVLSFPNVPGYLLSKLGECEAEWLLVGSVCLQAEDTLNEYMACMSCQYYSYTYYLRDRAI